MQLGDSVKPHDGLLLACSPGSFAPAWPPIRCQICETNWLHELDPLRPGQWDWICLYQASNILDPPSVFHQRMRSSFITEGALQGRRIPICSATALP
jgi:hypothetical protein